MQREAISDLGSWDSWIGVVWLVMIHAYYCYSIPTGSLYTLFLSYTLVLECTVCLRASAEVVNLLELFGGTFDISRCSSISIKKNV